MSDRGSEAVFRVLGYIRGYRRVHLSTFPANWSNRQETLCPGVPSVQKLGSTLFSSAGSWYKSKLEYRKFAGVLCATTYLEDSLPPPCNFTGFAAFMPSCRFSTQVARNFAAKSRGLGQAKPEPSRQGKLRPGPYLWLSRSRVKPGQSRVFWAKPGQAHP
jgi:hypothetical protein